MNSVRFKDLPPANDFKIPFELTEELLLAWLQELSKQTSQQACTAILQFLLALNHTKKLSANTRGAFLMTCHEYFKEYANHLEGAPWDASLPFSSKEQTYAESLVWNYLALSEGFFLVAQETNEQSEEVFALYMSLFCLGQAHLYTAAIYHNPSDFFWQLVYKIYAQGEKYNLLEKPINDTDLKNITLKKMFAQIFIFQSCDINQFRPRDMRTIFNFLPKVCTDFCVYKLTDVKFQTDVLKMSYLHAVMQSMGNDAEKNLAKKIKDHQDLFVFDLAMNNPPVIFNPSFNFNPVSLRYFTAATVVDNLERIIEKPEIGSGVLKSINHELFCHVIRTLMPGRKRKYARSPVHSTMLGVIGFENILSFLYKVGHKESIAQKSAALDVHKTAKEKINQYEIQLKPQMGAIDGGFAEKDFFYQTLSHNETIETHKLQKNISHREVSLKRVMIFDSSARGYLVHWPDDASSKAKIGDIFALVSHDKKRLEIAMIRRIAIEEDSYKFGTEILGFKSEAVLLTLVNQQKSCWGIFLPSVDKLEQPDSVIYPIGSFQTGDFIYISYDHKKIKAAIGKELNATVSIIHAELDYASLDYSFS